MSHTSLGLLLGDTGRMNEAEQHFDRALSIQTQLAADFPTRPPTSARSWPRAIITEAFC
ncbi:MAG: tetratricopeptide repeat protein [Gemmataceae bacterium]